VENFATSVPVQHKKVGFEILTDVTIFWDIVPCSQQVNQCLKGMLVHIQTTWCYISEDGNIPCKKFIRKYLFEEKKESAFQTGSTT
jgi:hypothetical protein